MGSLRPDEINSVEAAKEIIPSVLHITWTDKSTKIDYSGTGIVWNKEGVFSTNYHVIDGADASELRVTFADNTRCRKIRVLYAFRELDFAVLQVDDAPRDKLVPIPVSDSAKLRRGQRAYAIGHPHGYRNSFSAGCISGVDCEVESYVSGFTIQGFIQTDASINNGNSGGPLLDSSKKLVGINTCGYDNGVAFAIPGNWAKDIVDMVVLSTDGVCVEVKLKIRSYCDCDGCIQKITKIIQKFKGVESVDIHRAKYVVKGTMDLEELILHLEEKLKPAVRLRRLPGQTSRAKEVKLKIRSYCDCDGCIQKITRIIKKFKGVELVNFDRANHQATVKGTMAKELIPHLQEKLKPDVKMVLLRHLPGQTSCTKEVKLEIISCCNCFGCVEKITKIIKRFEGVELVNFDGTNNLATVKGTTVKELIPHLKEELKRDVEVVLPRH